MNGIKAYLDELTGMYGPAVKRVKSACDESALALVPEALREFYREYAEMQLPFGSIDPIEVGIENSKAEPLKSEGWFCFGFDSYFSLWLCRMTPDEENLSFTAWDHDSGCEIDGAVEQDLVAFLKSAQAQYAREGDLGSVMLTKMPNDKLKCLAATKKAFALTVTTGELLKNAGVLPYVVAEKMGYAQAKERIQCTGFPDCFTFVRNPR